MKAHNAPSLVVLPEADLQAMQATLAAVNSQLAAMANRPTPSPKKEWYTRQESMDLMGIRSTKHHQLNAEGKLRVKHVGRRLYVHHTSIDDYFSNK